MNYRDEIEIDLIDLLHVVLRKWRVIIAFMLLGAIALGALSYLKPVGFDKSSEPKVTIITKDELDALRDKLEDKEKETVLLAVSSFLINKEKYEDALEHQQDSIKNKINADNEPNMITTYMISDYIEDTHAYMAEVISADNIISLYSSALGSASVIQQIRDVTGYDVNELYIKEIYSVNKSGLSMMNISVTAPSRTECEAIMDVLEKNVSSLKSSINAVNRHKIEKVSENYYEQLDTGLKNTQRDEEQSIIDYKKSFLTVPKDYTEDQKKYYETLIDLAEGRLTLGSRKDKEAAIQKAEEESRLAAMQKQQDEKIEYNEFSDIVSAQSEVNILVSDKQVSKKYVVLGGFVGAFCVILWTCILYILSGTLRLETDLSDVFRLSVFGSIKTDGKGGKKRFLSAIDDFIDGMFNKNRPEFSEDECIDIVCSGISVSAKKKDAKLLYITGVGTALQSEVYKEKIAEALRKGNYLPEKCIVDFGKNVVYDPRSLEKMVQSDGVVLVEQIRSSRYENIGNELDVMSKYGVDVFGAIVLQ